jgi:hypothetical protein
MATGKAKFFNSQKGFGSVDEAHIDWGRDTLRLALASQLQTRKSSLSRTESPISIIVRRTG